MNWETLRSDEMTAAIEKSDGLCVLPLGCTETIGQAFNLFCARRLANIFKVLKEDEECIRIATGQK